jgi:hypothetical protein
MQAIPSRGEAIGLPGFARVATPRDAGGGLQRLDPLVEALGRAVDRLEVGAPTSAQRKEAC